jgi:outer membrane biosynthesis protein TonB
MDHDIPRITTVLFAIATILIVPAMSVAQAPYAPPRAPQAPQVYYPPQPIPSQTPVQQHPPVATQPPTAPQAPMQPNRPSQPRPAAQRQPGTQPQPSYQAQGRPSEYAFRPNLTNPEYGQCLNLEKRWQDPVSEILSVIQPSQNDESQRSAIRSAYVLLEKSEGTIGHRLERF